jgi:phospholipid N-methyltransferase
MYPFNKVSQFDKQVMTDIGGPVGSMILIRATKRPTQVKLGQMDEKFLNQINRQKPDSFYKMNADEFRLKNRESLLNDVDFIRSRSPVLEKDRSVLIPLAVLIILSTLIFIIRR